MPQAYIYFSFSLFTWSSYFVRKFRFSKAGSCVRRTLSHFKPREKSILFTYVYSQQNFFSSQLLWDNGTKGWEQTNSNPSKRSFIQRSLLNFCYNQPPARVYCISFVFSNTLRVLSQCNTRLSRDRRARWKVGGLTIENTFSMVKIEKRNKIIVFDLFLSRDFAYFNQYLLLFIGGH